MIFYKMDICRNQKMKNKEFEKLENEEIYKNPTEIT
jgi:hypothetical protein